MPVRQVSPWWWYWVFQNVTVQTTRVFAGSWAAARVVPNRRDSRGCQLEIVDVGMLSREVLQNLLGNVWLFMWLDDFYHMNGCQKTMLDCDRDLKKTHLVFHPTILLTDREGESLMIGEDLTCDRLFQHKGTTIRHHLPGGGCEAQKLWTSLLFISLENAKGFPVIIRHVVLCFDLGFQSGKGHLANFLPWGPLGLRVTIKLDDVGVNLDLKDLISWVTGLIQNIMGPPPAGGEGFIFSGRFFFPLPERGTFLVVRMPGMFPTSTWLADAGVWSMKLESKVTEGMWYMNLRICQAHVALDFITWVLVCSCHTCVLVYTCMTLLCRIHTLHYIYIYYMQGRYMYLIH